MGLTGEEIRHNLQVFAARWDSYKGSERAEAQTFLNQLFECYGQDRREVGARFEEPQKGKFLDLVWPGTCIFEMKRPSEAKKLARHRKQALDYWAASDDRDHGIARPRFVVLCAFSKLEIWEPGSYSKPVATIDLIDLANRYDALLFLAGDEPHFETDKTAVTLEAVELVTDLYKRLRERRAAGLEVLRDFVLQCIWCMFAEDLGQIEAHRFTQLLEALHKDTKRSSKDELGRMFEYLNTPLSEERHGMYRGTPYANGGLFRNPAQVHLEPDEIEMLLTAAKFRWNEVQPAIFGWLLKGGLGHDQQWQLAAHYTHEEDVQKIVQPTIVEPWVERIENITKHSEAVAAQNDLLNYIVLDPSCGSGNFLYVAYRELRKIEKRLRELEQDLRRRDGKKDQGSLSLFFPLSNMRGIELDGFAVALARVTLWMGHKLAVDAYDLPEPTLPLADLSGIQQGDALRMTWPKASVIIGNPPFHGSQRMQKALGKKYVSWLKDTFNIGVKDYCVYWFRLAHDTLPSDGRAGLVGTNSISQNRARGVSLEYIVENGGVLTSAVSSQSWSGEANVHVSIVNWIKEPVVPVERFILDGQDVEAITPSLRASSVGSEEQVHKLAANKKRCFQGVTPSGKGFVLSKEEAVMVLAADHRNDQVVRPYLGSKDIGSSTQQEPSRFIIDFASMKLEEASTYSVPIEIVRAKVKIERTANSAENPESDSAAKNAKNWWLFEATRPGMRNALAGLSRYIAAQRHGDRALMTWVNAKVCPSGANVAFAFSDDYSMGILSSGIHRGWLRRRSSTIKSDNRFTPTTAFETFPWPQATESHRKTIGMAGKALIDKRTELCNKHGIGLTELYNQMDEGAFVELSKLHVVLDEFVAIAYGWPKAVALDVDESNRCLLELNQEIAAGDVSYTPFEYLPT